MNDRKTERTNHVALILLAMIVALGFLLIPHDESAKAQSATQTPDEFAPLAVGNFRVGQWSSDSQYFYFSQEPYGHTDNRWYTFHAESRTLTTEDDSPFLPKLTPNEINTYKLTLNDYQIGEPVYFVSPNERILVFARQVSCGEFTCLYHLVLADRHTKAIFDTDTHIYYPFNFEALNIKWNHAGTAFVVSQFGEFACCEAKLTTYVTGFMSGLTQTRATTAIATPRISSQSYKRADAFAFSDDDKTLFIRALDASNQFVLIAYNLAHPEQSLVLPKSIGAEPVAIGFAPHSQKNVLIFNANGLIQYNADSHQVWVLNDKLNTVNEVRQAWVSPNGEWFAYESRSRELYVIRLATQTEDIFTPTPQ